MKIWYSLRAPLLVIISTTVALLLTWWVVTSGRAGMIVPKPEVAAEEMMKALAAHRYEAVLEALSSSLEQSTSETDLSNLIERTEQAHGKIDEVKGELLNEHNDTAITSVQVRFDNGSRLETNIPLVKESGVWKVAGLDGLDVLLE